MSFSAPLCTRKLLGRVFLVSCLDKERQTPERALEREMGEVLKALNSGFLEFVLLIALYP